MTSIIAIQLQDRATNKMYVGISPLILPDFDQIELQVKQMAESIMKSKICLETFRARFNYITVWTSPTN